MIAGIEVTGQQDAIRQICDFLDAWEQRDAVATWWPETIARAEHERMTPAKTGPGRASWCYGVPGQARSQQLAGLAIGDPDRERRAEAAMAACLTDARQLDQVTDAGICHAAASAPTPLSRRHGPPGSAVPCRGASPVTWTGTAFPAPRDCWKDPPAWN